MSTVRGLSLWVRSFIINTDMTWFMILLYLKLVVVAVSTGQTDKFDYECDVLSRLDRLEHALEEATESFENELKESTVKLGILEHELQESTEKLGSVENELKTAKESQNASDIKLTEAVDEILSLKNQLEGRTATGSTFVRWGRTTCPGNGTELVYAGFVGGSHYTHSGAAVNYLCLPQTPLYGKYYEDNLQNGGQVYGAEYEFFYFRTNQMAFFPDIDQSTVLHDNEVPCAVCRTHRSTVLMVPARYTCMDGWTLEYKGLLVAGRIDHAAASEYVCLDDQPESIVVEGGGKNDNGILFYLVEGRCGSLQCPPYVNGREFTCAVCSK